MSTGKIRRLDLWWLRDSQQVPPQAKRAPCIPYPPTLKPHSPLLRWLRAPADGRAGIFLESGGLLDAGDGAGRKNQHGPGSLGELRWASTYPPDSGDGSVLLGLLSS